jgi:hypothetical protein
VLTTEPEFSIGALVGLLHDSTVADGVVGIAVLQRTHPLIIRQRRLSGYWLCGYGPTSGSSPRGEVEAGRGTLDASFLQELVTRFWSAPDAT